LTFDTGAKQRMEILKTDAARKILDPLATHGWTARIERSVEAGDYLVVTAERGGQTHRVGFLYTSATDNRVYKTLAQQVEYIFFNGAPYMVESFTGRVDKPVGPVDDFPNLLFEWNAAAVTESLRQSKRRRRKSQSVPSTGYCCRNSPSKRFG
jgi:hypothetical protein